MLKILLIEDHILFRELLVPTLEELQSRVIIYQATTIDEGSNLIKYYKEIDLLILDLSYPNEHLWNNFPFGNSKVKTIPIIILTGSTNIDDLNNAIKRGCRGYITKSSNKQQLLIGIKTVLSGNTYISADMLSLLEKSENSGINIKYKNSPLLDKLSSRQIEILNLLTKGDSNKNIATKCKISEGTVKLHVSTILKILGVSNRTQAVIKVNELNLL